LVAILIVEDDLDLAETYADLLQAHQHSVVMATTVSAALKLIEAAKPAIIILDLNLPDNSGFAIIKHVHKNAPNEIRLIIISGHSEMARQADLATSSDLVLNKPVSNDQLLTLINRISAHSRS